MIEDISEDIKKSLYVSNFKEIDKIQINSYINTTLDATSFTRGKFYLYKINKYIF